MQRDMNVCQGFLKKIIAFMHLSKPVKPIRPYCDFKVNDRRSKDDDLEES